MSEEVSMTGSIIFFAIWIGLLVAAAAKLARSAT
jgi:hypothetical protein